MGINLSPTNRENGAIARNVDFGQVVFPSVFNLKGRTDIIYLPQMHASNFPVGCDAKNFLENTSIKEFVMQDDCPNIDNFARAFANCPQLERVILPNLVNCTQIFSLCNNDKNNTYNLKSVEVGDIGTNKSNVTASYLFANGANKLESVKLGDCNKCYLGYMFAATYTTTLTELYIKKLPLRDLVDLCIYNLSNLNAQSYANLMAALPDNTGNAPLNIKFNSAYISKKDSTKYTAKDAKTGTDLNKTLAEWETYATSSKNWTIQTT